MSFPVGLFLALEQRRVTQVEYFLPETKPNEKTVPPGAAVNADGPQRW